MSVEDAARVTKIRPQQIVDLERDEYSNFANLAYARGFFVGYAKFLHVDVRPYLEGFEDANTFGLDDYQYLSEVPVGVYRAPTRQVRRPRRRKPRFVAAGTTLGLLAVVVTAWFFVVSYRRLGGDLEKLAARQEARDRAARQGGGAGGSEAMVNGKTPAAAPAVETIRVSAPSAEPPAPSPSPVNDKTVVTTATLAATDNSNAVPVGPVKAPLDNVAPAVPLPGDGAATHALTQGTDFRASLAAAPATVNAQVKIRAAKPVLDPGKGPNDPYQGNVPQPVANNTVR